MSQDVTLDQVTMRFGDFTAVRDVNLRIEPGEFFAFLGPSGCGKTTILRLVSGFIEPSQGRVSIGGRDMRGIGPNRRPTALIFQNLALFPLMPIWENIASASRSEASARPSAANAPSSCSTSWRCRIPLTSVSASCPAARSSAWPSHARWLRIPR